MLRWLKYLQISGEQSSIFILLIYLSLLYQARYSTVQYNTTNVCIAVSLLLFIYQKVYYNIVYYRLTAQYNIVKNSIKQYITTKYCTVQNITLQYISAVVQISYKASLLHLQPRQMRLILTELRQSINQYHYYTKTTTIEFIFQFYKFSAQSHSMLLKS